MSAPSSCCRPCPDVQTEEVPGIEGDPGIDGVDGTNGVNAYTITTADDNLPAVSGTVTIDVADTSWMVVGQILFVENWGFVEVTAILSATQVTVENLGYSVNAAPGTPCGNGAGVSPGGSQPDLTGLAADGVNNDITELTGLTVPLSEAQGGTGLTGPITPLVVYADSGAAYVIPTTTPTLITVGAQAAELALTTPGTWLIETVLRFDIVAVTNATTSLITADLYRSNNTPGNITNGEMAWHASIPSTALTQTGNRVVTLPPIIYKTPNSNDNLQVRISKSAAIDTSGDYKIGTACIVATWLNSETA